MTRPAIPEHQPGEPLRTPHGLPRFIVGLMVRLVLFSIYVTSTLWLWPLYWLGAMIWGWPPNVVRMSQVGHFLQMIWTRRPRAPGIPLRHRVWLTWCVMFKVGIKPLFGLAWLLDELLYGRQLDATPITAPLIKISAARSGSTQIARYLEEDPHLASPSLAQFMYPYLWAWKLLPPIIMRFTTPEGIIKLIRTQIPEEFVERHEGNIFQTDTFEGFFYMAHLFHLSGFLGPRAMAEEFTFAYPTPLNMTLWENEFIQIFERIGKKTLLFAGPAEDGKPRRLFIKGHFICAGDALGKRFPDARFVTNLREPAPRLQSAINFIRANPVEMSLGFMDWGWLAEAAVKTEGDYCKKEMDWFKQDDGLLKCVIRFKDYVKDLEGAMSKIYSECLDTDELPPHVPREHPPRNRTNYLLNRRLEELGVDVDALNEDLSEYIEWCQPVG